MIVNKNLLGRNYIREGSLKNGDHMIHVEDSK